VDQNKILNCLKTKFLSHIRGSEFICVNILKISKLRSASQI